MQLHNKGVEYDHMRKVGGHDIHDVESLRSFLHAGCLSKQDPHRKEIVIATSSWCGETHGGAKRRLTGCKDPPSG